jgi:hypothetical protein
MTRPVSVGLLAVLLHACGRMAAQGDDAFPHSLRAEPTHQGADAPSAGRPGSLAFRDPCVDRPSTNLTAPIAAAPDGGIGWMPSPRERWTNAMIGYQSVVRGVNQRPLGRDRKDFGMYMVTMHNRIHPVFSDRYVEWLTTLPPTDSLNDMGLTTLVEMAINHDGSISQLGVVCSSGNEDFDIGVLDSIAQAGPFRSPPTVTLSNDGKFYVRWWFARDAVQGCSTINARPYMLVLGVVSDAGVAAGR